MCIHSTPHRTTNELIALIRKQNQRIASLIWNDHLGMLNQAGLHDAIAQLPGGAYTVVFCDINRLKVLNSITGNHLQTNRYLRDGLRVRRGEIAGQYFGDEFLFVLAGDADAAAFCARITRQLAEQPLNGMERAALSLIEACAPEHARLSATFAWRESVPRDSIVAAIEPLSKDVLAEKAKRDARRADHVC